MRLIAKKFPTATRLFFTKIAKLSLTSILAYRFAPKFPMTSILVKKYAFVFLKEPLFKD